MPNPKTHRMSIMFAAPSSLPLRCMALTLVCVLGRGFSVLAEHPSAVTQEANPTGNAFPLRNVPALQVKVTGDFKRPKVGEVLEKLRASTGLDLTLDNDINQKYPALGSLSCRNTPAWVVMEELAKSKRIEGRWEKDGSGYRLVRNGNPVVIPEASDVSTETTKRKTSSTLMFFIPAASLLLILSLAYWWVRRRTGRMVAPLDKPTKVSIR